jgi:thiamine-phosphate pyrophosphorylase
VSTPAAPRVIVIPDPRFAAGATHESLAAAAIAGGADAIQLRAKTLQGPGLVALGRLLAARCRAAGALFFVNDDAEAARECGADGVHVGPGDCAPGRARRLLGARGLLGVSVYTGQDLAAAEEARADYVAVGAVYPTATKRVLVVGLDGLRSLRARTRLPIVAIGGIDAGNAAAAIAAGADGVAVISAVCAAADPEAATRGLRAAVDGALAARQAATRRLGQIDPHHPGR